MADLKSNQPNVTVAPQTTVVGDDLGLMQEAPAPADDENINYQIGYQYRTRPKYKSADILLDDDFDFKQ
jgi:hypothetical protein